MRHKKRTKGLTNITFTHHNLLHSDKSTYATSSICPKGWRLPLSGGNTGSKSFSKLTASYGIGSNADGSNILKAAPLYFIFSGYVAYGTMNNVGSFGNYWSSTAASDSRAYSLDFASANVYPSNDGWRYNGFPVRCVAK